MRGSAPGGARSRRARGDRPARLALDELLVSGGVLNLRLLGGKPPSEPDRDLGPFRRDGSAGNRQVLPKARSRYGSGSGVPGRIEGVLLCTSSRFLEVGSLCLRR